MGLRYSKLRNLGLRTALRICKPLHRRVQTRNTGIDGLAENPEVFFRDRVSQFLEHRSERVRQRLGGRLTEEPLKVLVDLERVHGVRLRKGIPNACGRSVQAFIHRVKAGT